MRTILAIALLLTTTAAVAEPIPERVEKLEKAIAHAEGFDRKNTIPSRYHNPGDLKSRPGIAKLPGQVRIGKAGHIVFHTDADGWTALQDYIAKLNEKHGTMTLQQIAKRYAQNWRPWLRIVTHEIGVDPRTPLGVYLEPVTEARND